MLKDLGKIAIASIIAEKLKIYLIRVFLLLSFLIYFQHMTKGELYILGKK